MTGAPIRIVVIHGAGPAWQPGRPLFEQPGVREHVAHYRRLLEEGRLAFGGPFLDEHGGGMMITVPGVDAAEVAAFAAADPAVLSGLLTCTVRPWMVGMES